jgi:hypothetical protein
MWQILLAGTALTYVVGAWLMLTALRNPAVRRGRS